MLAEEAHFALIDTMVQCCIRSLPARPEDALRIGLAACATLASEHGGVLAWPPRHHNGRCLFALRRAGAVVAAVAAAGAADPEILPALAPLLETMALVCDDVMINLAEAEAKASKGGVAHKLSSWQLRVALGAALAEVLRLDPRLLQARPPLLPSLPALTPHCLFEGQRPCFEARWTWWEHSLAGAQQTVADMRQAFLRSHPWLPAERGAGRGGRAPAGPAG